MNADKKQLQIIHIAKEQLKLDDESYRDLLQDRFNVSSAKDLSYKEADGLINFFKSKGFKIKKKRATVTMGDKTIKLASRYQFELINVLKSNIIWRESYEAWLNKRMKIKKVLSAYEAFKVIEGLKGMLGIRTKIIELKALPFPMKQEEPLPEGWFFDLSQGKLIYINAANEETDCLTKK